MSYAQRKELSGNRTLAIILVVVIQFALGYAIVTGLAYNVIKKAAEDLKTFDVEEQPPPPEEPPPPPKDMPKVPPPPMTPPPLVRMNSAAAADPDGRVADHRRRSRRRSHRRRRRRRRRRARSMSAQSAKGDLRALFSADDYPASAQAAGAEGTAQAHADDRPRRPRDRLQHHPVDRQRRARFGDLQHPAPPRQVHAGARQQRQCDDRHRLRRRRSPGVCEG